MNELIDFYYDKLSTKIRMALSKEEYNNFKIYDDMNIKSVTIHKMQK